MTIPATAVVQFATPDGTFLVDSLTDPSGDPPTVLDIDKGFTLAGRIRLSGFITGTGRVRLFADEIGGPIDKQIGSADVPIVGAVSPQDPPVIDYAWSIQVASPTLPDPSPDSGIYQFGLSFVLENPVGGHTDIGAFFDLGAFLVV